MFKGIKITCILVFCFCYSVKAQNFKVDSLKQVLNTDIHDTTRIMTLDHIGHGVMRKGDLKAAQEYSEQALELATKLNFKRGIAAANNTLGNIYTEKSDYARSLIFHQKALALRQELKYSKGIAASYNNIGIIYYNLSDYNKAIEYLQKALKLQEKLGNRFYEAVGIGNIAVLYAKLGEDSLALFYQEKSLRLHKEMGNKSDMVASLNHLGSLHRSKKEYRKSREYLEQALDLLKVTDELKPRAETQGNLGLLYYDMGKYEEAVVCFENGLTLAEQFGDKKVQTEQLTMLGRANKGLKKNAIAKGYYEKAYAMAKEIGSLEDQQSAAQGLYELYRESGNTKEALHFHEILTGLKDSIFNTEKNVAFNNLKMQFALDRQEHELKTAADEELKKRDIEKKQQRFVSYVIIAILCIVLLFSYFLFQRFRVTNAQKKIIEEQKFIVEIKNKEVTDSIVYAGKIQQSLLTTEVYIHKNMERLKSKK